LSEYVWNYSKLILELQISNKNVHPWLEVAPRYQYQTDWVYDLIPNISDFSRHVWLKYCCMWWQTCKVNKSRMEEMCNSLNTWSNDPAGNIFGCNLDNNWAVSGVKVVLTLVEPSLRCVSILDTTWWPSKIDNIYRN
jgi:hypothetical protein